MNKKGFLLSDGKKTNNLNKLKNISYTFFPNFMSTCKAHSGFQQKVESPSTVQMEKEPIFKKAFNIFSPQLKNYKNYNSSSFENKTAQNENTLSNYPSKKIEYKLETFHRSNQDTCLTHKPAVFEGDWVQSGDFLTDCANSVGGELALGQNIFIAYMPWEGYNFEDAILISERLVSDDLFTSVHIERYEIENIQKNGISQQESLTNKEISEKKTNRLRSGTRKTSTKNVEKSDINTSKIRTTRYEEITRDIPDLMPEETCHLDSFGIVKIGSIVEEGDILVGKITPINKKEFTPYQKLLYTILNKPIRPYRDSSLRAPKGIKAKVIDIKIFVKPGSVVRGSSTDKLRNYQSVILSNAKPYLKKKKLKKGKQSKSRIFIKNSKLLKCKDVTGAALTGLGAQKRTTFLELLKKTSSNALPNLDKLEILQNKIFWAQKSFNKKNKIRHFLLHGIKPQNSFNSFIDIESTKETNLSSRILDSHLLSKVSFSDTLKKKENVDKNDILPKGIIATLPKFSAIPFYNKKFKKSSHVIKTLQTIVYGQFKDFKIMKKLKKNYGDILRNITQEKLNFLKKDKKTFNSYNTKSIKDIETIHIYLAEKRKIQVGDKMSGRHGNKGIVSQILPMQDMPFLPDGTPIDMVLNPLGVPSRMNVGQIYECLLGLAGKYLGEHYKITAFDEIYGPEASRSFVFNKLYEARCKTGFKWLFNPQYPGKIRLYDGRTGDCYHQPVTVGQSYMLRLVHMVDDKIHMRSTGPYSLVTQQPLRGRSKQGGQRLGEMEVWALEGFGAAFTLLEMLTVKSDDLTGRMTLWSNLILNKDLTIGTPEAFKVLICELQALCLDIGLYRYNTTNTTNSFLGENSNNLSEKSSFVKGPQKSLTEMTSLMSFP
jgi:DNA-directed RNA polymerase subunit beta